MPRDRRTLVGLGLIAALIAIAYHRVFSAGFVNFDDPDYVFENARVRAGITLDGIFWAFSSVRASNWHPLTWLSHMLDCQLFGLDARGHHAVNLMWHVANTGMLFLALDKLTGARAKSLAVAALFAIHPVNVESVAWIAERKNLLSLFFGLLAIHQYARHVVDKRPMWPVAVALGLSLLAKPMLVTLPCLLLVLDYWPLRRRWDAERIGEKLPLIALAMISCVVTMHVQDGAMSLFPELKFPHRIANSILSYGIYLRQVVWPSGLTAFYPHPVLQLPWAEVPLSLAALAGISELVRRHARERGHLAAGWLWFLGTMVPMIGLVQVGHQAHADRYLYLPMIGLLIAVVWQAAERLREPRLPIATALACVALLPITVRQVGFWQNSISLWERAIALGETTDYDLFVARTNLAEAYGSLGRLEDGVKQLQRALETCQGRRCTAPLFSLGQLARSRGDTDAAMKFYRRGMEAAPDEPLVHHEAGLLLALNGRLAEALPLLRRAVELSPHRGDFHLDLALVLLDTGDHAGAEREQREGLRVEPTFVRSASEIAWRLAISPRSSGWPEAFFRARQVCLLTGCGDPQGVKFFAAAHAAVGHFEEAAKIEGKLIEFAKHIGNEGMRRESEQRQALYASGKGLWALTPSGRAREATPSGLERAPGSTGP